MTSLKKIMANRANAQHSTGPRSAAGKAASRRNAEMHGLSVPAAAIPELAGEITALARHIAGEQGEDPFIWAAAIRVAEATIELLRVRRVRTDLLNDLMLDLGSPELPPVEDLVPSLPRPASMHATAAGARTKQAERLFPGAVLGGADGRGDHHSTTGVQSSNPDLAVQRGKHRGAKWERLEKLERYERRALSRRRTAIKALDTLKAPS